MTEFNQEYPYNFSDKQFISKVIRNVKNYSVKSSSIIINLSMETIIIYPDSSDDLNTLRKLNKWQSDNFKNVIIKEANSVLIIEDSSFNTPDFSNINTSNFPMMDLNYFENTQLIRNDIRKEISTGLWEHVSKLYPELEDLSLWKTPESNIKVIEKFRFDPYFAIGMSKEYDDSKEIDFMLKNYIWFAPQKTHCKIHNQHPFIEFHTQLSGIGRMIKYTYQNSTKNYEDQRLAVGNSQSHTYCKLNEFNKEQNKLQLSYPWHEYYSDTDCIWLVTEFWPIGNKK
ncbi:MAG: hypothetical protein ABF289_09345 [Clostridiales bacterium]